MKRGKAVVMVIVIIAVLLLSHAVVRGCFTCCLRTVVCVVKCCDQLLYRYFYCHVNVLNMACLPLMHVIGLLLQFTNRQQAAVTFIASFQVIHDNDLWLTCECSHAIWFRILSEPVPQLTQDFRPLRCVDLIYLLYRHGGRFNYSAFHYAATSGISLPGLCRHHGAVMSTDHRLMKLSRARGGARPASGHLVK